MSGPRDVAASVAARLLNKAKATGDDYQVLLTNWCLERFLYRLGQSASKDRFILKGAMLLRLWSDQPYRATRDLDFLRRGDVSIEAIRADLQTAIGAPVPPDAVIFDGDDINFEAIRASDEFVGLRALLPARCGRARVQLQIDIGTGDAVWPEPEWRTCSTLLDFPAPRVLAYAREAVVAEKLEAIVVLGERNSRIKDFFDLHYIAQTSAFDRAVLREAVFRTFAKRRTTIPDGDPIGLTAAFWDNPTRPAQVRAFARRAGLAVPRRPDEEMLPTLRAFLCPVLGDLREATTCRGTWPPGGPWRADA